MLSQRQNLLSVISMTKFSKNCLKEKNWLSVVSTINLSSIISTTNFPSVISMENTIKVASMMDSPSVVSMENCVKLMSLKCKVSDHINKTNYLKC